MINLLNKSVRKAEKMIKIIRETENELWDDYKEIADKYGADSIFAVEKRIVWGTVHNIMIESGIKTVKRIIVDNQEIIK
tara:strand:- start:158 stop:394 length:237 start_codon:yes stop_codon:yes gene_type:complete